MAEKEKIQEVPEGWKKTELGNTLMLIRNGFSGQQVQYTTKFPITRIETISNGYIDYQKVGYVNDSPFSYLLKIGDILISNINSIKHIGKIAIYRGLQPLYHGMNLLILRVNQDNDSLFLYYALLSKKSWFEKVAAQAVNQASINQSTLRKCSLLIPLSIPEQRTIASILSTCDEAIEKTDAKIEKLKRIKQGLMQDLFRYGIDENGKMRSKATHRFKDSPLGRIPEEWEVVKLKEIGEIVTGTTPSTKKMDFYDGNYMFISPSDVSENAYISKTEKTLTKSGLLAARPIPKDSICVVCIGSTIGKIGITSEGCSSNQQINSIVCNEDNIVSFYYYLCGQFLIKQLKIEAGLQAVPIVNKETFSRLLIPKISKPEQSRIASILSSADEAIKKEEAYKNKLLSIKRGLMDDLLSGKVRVNKLTKEAA